MELNKIYKWSDIVKEYPDKYAVITDAKRESGEIITCKLLDICTKEEKHLYRKKYTGLGIFFEIQRTTCNDPIIGVLV